MRVQEGQVKIQDGILIDDSEGNSLEADLSYPPNDDVKRPAILFIHGGGWREGDRSQLRGYAILLARLGFVTLVLLIVFQPKQYGLLKYEILTAH